MRGFFALGVILAGFSVPAVAAERSDLPATVPSPVQRVFVPHGFDDNDNVEVILRGVFPNSCYRTADSQVRLDEQTKTVTIQANSFKYSGRMCLQAETPFLQEVKLGLMGQGNYKLIVNGNQSGEVQFSVNKATSTSPDDYLYAPVDFAELVNDEGSGGQYITLQGTYPHMFIGCAMIKEVKTYVNPSDVLVVLPVMEIKTGEGECAGYQHNYRVSVPMTQKFLGSGLLHVRVLNGEAVNRFVDSGNDR